MVCIWLGKKYFWLDQLLLATGKNSDLDISKFVIVSKCSDYILTLGCQIDEYTRLFGTKETWRKKQTQRQTKVFNENPPYSFIWSYSFNWHLRVSSSSKKWGCHWNPLQPWVCKLSLNTYVRIIHNQKYRTNGLFLLPENTFKSMFNG